MRKSLLLVAVLLCRGPLLVASSFEPLSGDLSDYDPSRMAFPTSGDTIKVGVFFPFSGPGAINGYRAWAVAGWVAHDINSQGGVEVDGNLKKIQLVRADHQGKPATAKRVAERLCLEDEVDVIVGTSGTHLNLIGQQVAAKYKTIYLNTAALSDMLMDEENFNRYTFRACPTTTMYGRALASYYAERPEQRFYILCQDYAYGHAFGEAFKRSLASAKPSATIVGEDYHRLGAADFAPYLEKVRGYGAEVIITGDWPTDIDNLIKQSRQLGLDIPISGPFVGFPNPLRSIGGPAGRGLVAVSDFDITRAGDFADAWNDRAKTWDVPPYESASFHWPTFAVGQQVLSIYWFFEVMSRAGSTNPEKIITAFEGSEHTMFGHKGTMDPETHQAVFDMYATALEFPNNYYEDAAGPGRSITISADIINAPETNMTAPPAAEQGRVAPPLSMYVSQAIHGLTYGMLLFLVASGLTLIFGMMGVLNLAHASFFMLAAYLSYQVLSVTGNFWLALLLAPIAVALLGLLMERYLLRRIRSHALGHTGDLLLTLGIALVIMESVKLVWGADSLVVPIPEALSGQVSLAGLPYPAYRLFIVGLSLGILSIFGLVLWKSRLGAIVRAIVADAEMVGALGINVARVSMAVFGIGTWMAGIAGVAAAPLLTVFPGMADQMSLDAFVVVVVGGLGSLSGALLVSLILGELNAFGIQFLPRLAPVIVFGFMALVLAFRPMGFFGERK